MNEDILHKRIDDAFKEIWNSPSAIPIYIQKNLQHELRPYQKQALEHFMFIQEQASSNDLARHLLFHMATGSGKTMVLAATILYLYREQNFNKFLFFVNSDAIIRKTRDNLTNPTSSKYLFDPKGMEVDGRSITIQLVDAFPHTSEANTIYLKLTTIQKLHRELEEPRENGLTYQSLSEYPLVLLSDEAHHINVETKKKNPDRKVLEERNWETTVTKIMNSNSSSKMLEFTATLDLTKPSLFAKYKDKIVYQYDLRRFMNDGFSKNVLLARTNEDDASKMLNAILLSQYRKYVANEIGLELKPVIMFKSQKIAFSKQAKELLFTILDELTMDDLKRRISRELTLHNGEGNIWEEMFHYYSQVDLAKVIRDLKSDLTIDTVLTVDTQEIFSERDALLLNTLEDMNNPIRAIFAVAKLNEGWDVLNLYDIVRLSEKASNTKTATDSEAQLIGRGARYYPFEFMGERSFTRRFDLSQRHLSILENLHYHTINDSTYINNLEKSLDAAGIVTREEKIQRFEAKLKRSFLKTSFFKEGKIYINRWVETTVEDYRSLSDYQIGFSHTTTFEKALETHYGKKATLNVGELGDYHDEQLLLDRRFWLKAIQRNKFFRYHNLKNYLPSITSMNEFILDEHFLGGVTITVRLPNKMTVQALTANEKLTIVEAFLKEVEVKIMTNYAKEKGTPEFEGVAFSSLINDYVIETNLIRATVANSKEIVQAYPMRGNDWFIYDQAIVNGLEYELIKEINVLMDELEEKYQEVYLVRNERKVKVREIDGVRGFMPDFLLFLKDEEVTYQVFLEPKGKHLSQHDKWKEEFLLSLTTREDITILHDSDSVRLLGIKFFSDEQPEKEWFKKDFRTKLLPDSKGEVFRDGLFRTTHPED